MKRDLVIGVSLSTWWFIGVWSDLLPFLYLRATIRWPALPCWNDFGAVVTNVTLLGVGFASRASSRGVVRLDANAGGLGAARVAGRPRQRHPDAFSIGAGVPVRRTGPGGRARSSGPSPVDPGGRRGAMARQDGPPRDRNAHYPVSARAHHVRTGRVGHVAGRRKDAVRRGARPSRCLTRRRATSRRVDRLRRARLPDAIRDAAVGPRPAGARPAARAVPVGDRRHRPRRSDRAIDAVVPHGAAGP